MTVKNGEMAVKFYYNGQKYGVALKEGDVDNIVPVLNLIFAQEGMYPAGITDLACYHLDGKVESLVPIYNPNGELVRVGKKVDERG